MTKIRLPNIEIDGIQYLDRWKAFCFTLGIFWVQFCNMFFFGGMMVCTLKISGELGTPSLCEFSVGGRTYFCGKSDRTLWKIMIVIFHRKL